MTTFKLHCPNFTKYTPPIMGKKICVLCIARETLYCLITYYSFLIVATGNELIRQKEQSGPTKSVSQVAINKEIVAMSLSYIPLVVIIFKDCKFWTYPQKAIL